MQAKEKCPTCQRHITTVDGKFVTHRTGRSQRHLKAIRKGNKITGTHKVIRTSHSVKPVCPFSGKSRGKVTAKTVKAA